MERLTGRFDQPRGVGSDLDDIKSIPKRAAERLKDEAARREGGSSGSASTGFDRANGSTDKDKARTADASTRAEPPSREPTKAKAAGETTRGPRSRGDFGTTSRPTDTRSKPEPVSRPERAPATGASNPPSVSGAATTEKKKPPQN